MHEVQRPILKSGQSDRFPVRILRPSEYDSLWEACKADAQVQIDAALLTGMRYIELQRLHDNPSWFEPKGFVYLPTQAVLKAKRRQRQRWVKLNEKGIFAIPRFLNGKQLPSWQTWTDRLHRWGEDAGLDPIGLGPKTFRKTWESWLMFYYPEHGNQIVLNQGHTSFTSIGHYINMPFLPEDKVKMKEYVEGMF